MSFRESRQNLGNYFKKANQLINTFIQRLRNYFNRITSPITSRISNYLSSINQFISPFTKMDFDKKYNISVIFCIITILLAFLFDLIPGIKIILLNILLYSVLIDTVWIYINDNTDRKMEFMNNKRFWVTILDYAALLVIMDRMGNPVFMVEVIIFTALYGIMAISLNMSTGIVGILNFGVIAQVAVGAVILGITTVRGMSIIYGVLFAILGGAIFSGLLAITTLRLRDDYFAIVSITISEIIRQLLITEPSLRAVHVLPVGQRYSTTPGILAIPQPFYNFVVKLFQGTFLEPYGYRFFLGLFGFLLLFLTLLFADILFKSPWGRVLRGIREDELVVSTYGKNVLWHKVAIMCISGGVAGLAGAYMGWAYYSLFPENFQLVFTFYVWTVFIIGGRGNNKGMIVGAMIFTLTLRTSRFLDNPDNPIIKTTNYIVHAINPQSPNITLGYLQLVIVGLILILFLRFAPRGILAEEPYEPSQKISSVKPTTLFQILLALGWIDVAFIGFFGFTEFDLFSFIFVLLNAWLLAGISHYDNIKRMIYLISMAALSIYSLVSFSILSLPFMVTIVITVLTFVGFIWNKETVNLFFDKTKGELTGEMK